MEQYYLSRAFVNMSGVGQPVASGEKMLKVSRLKPVLQEPVAEVEAELVPEQALEPAGEVTGE
jgi:hypothetical protein